MNDFPSRRYAALIVIAALAVIRGVNVLQAVSNGIYCGPGTPPVPWCNGNNTISVQCNTTSANLATYPYPTLQIIKVFDQAVRYDYPPYIVPVANSNTFTYPNVISTSGHASTATVTACFGANCYQSIPTVTMPTCGGVAPGTIQGQITASEKPVPLENILVELRDGQGKILALTKTTALTGAPPYNYQFAPTFNGTYFVDVWWTAPRL